MLKVFYVSRQYPCRQSTVQGHTRCRSPTISIHPCYFLSGDSPGLVIDWNHQNERTICGFVTMMKLVPHTLIHQFFLKILCARLAYKIFASVFYTVVQQRNLGVVANSIPHLVITTVKESLKASYV